MGDVVVSGGTSSAGTNKWLPIRRHADVAAAFGALRSAGFTVWAAHPDSAAIDYREVDFTAPTCILLGAELHGLSPEAVERADRLVTIPMEEHSALRRGPPRLGEGG